MTSNLYCKNNRNINCQDQSPNGRQLMTQVQDQSLLLIEKTRMKDMHKAVVQSLQDFDKSGSRQLRINENHIKLKLTISTQMYATVKCPENTQLFKEFLENMKQIKKSKKSKTKDYIKDYTSILDSYIKKPFTLHQQHIKSLPKSGVSLTAQGVNYFAQQLAYSEQYEEDRERIIKATGDENWEKHLAVEQKYNEQRMNNCPQIFDNLKEEEMLDKREKNIKISRQNNLQNEVRPLNAKKIFLLKNVC